MQLHPFEPYELLWLFFIYSFLGWCAEVAYAAMTTGRLVNRGFLNGPLCPIYGFGMAAVLTLLLPLQESLPVLVAGSMLLTTLIELAGGWALKTLFHTRWWDYSDKPLNLGGYICLEFSVYWGVGAAVMVRLVHPQLFRLVGWLPRPLGWAMLAVLAGLFAVDFAATLKTIAGLEHRLEELDAAAASLRAYSDRLTARVGSAALELDERLDEGREELEARRLAAEVELEDRLTEAREEYLEERAELQARLDLLRAELLDSRLAANRRAHRLLRAFPRMENLRHTGLLAELRDRLER